MSQLWMDVRHAARLFGRQPVLASIVVMTLALGIGGNAAIFSVANALLLQPLPLPESERLVFVTGHDKDGQETYISYPDFQELRRDATLVEGFTSFVPQSVNLTGRPEPERVRGGFVSEEFFDLVRVPPVQGRSFRRGDDALGAPGVCVLNHETWQRVFGGDAGIVGREIVLNNAPFTVVGVMPAGFRFPFDEVEVWIPFHHWPVFAANYQSRSNGLVSPLARLKPGVTLQQFRAELETLGARLAHAYPEAGEGRGFQATSLRETLVADARVATLILLGAVTLVLLIACANVANLLLSHTASRLRELATRMALGAGRSRLVRQLVSENLMLWLAGGVAGMVLAHWGLAALLATAPVELPAGIRPTISPAVLAYTLGLTALSGLGFGLLPALRFSRPNVFEAMKDGARGAGEVPGRTRLHSVLVVSQLALTLLLLAGAGLMLRSLENLTRVPLGYRADSLLTLEYRLPANKYPEGAQQWQFHKTVVERVRRLPGVQAASVVRALPFGGNRSSVKFEAPDQPAFSQPNAPTALLNTADEFYFATMGIPLLRGRVFDEHDSAETPPVIVVNHALAERVWPGNDPVGRTLRLMGEPPRVATVVGVVGDVKHDSLEDAAQLQIYAAQPQNPHIFNTLVVRTAGDPMSQAGNVRAAVWSVDKDQPVWKVRTLESLVERSLGLRRFLLRLLGFYAVLALALAALGLYGVTSYGVTSRTHEIGVRVAVGARRGEVLALVLRRGLGLAALGVVVGLVAALALGRVMSGLVFGIGANDPVTLAAVSAVLLGIALLASYLPARRATLIDPVRALRCD